MTKLQEFILPGGPLVPDDYQERRNPFGEPPIDPEEAAGEAAADMAAIAEALQPQMERERERQEREREESAQRAAQREKEAPFRAWLRELSEILATHPGEEVEGRTEIEFSLYRIEKTGGTDGYNMLQKITRTPREAMAEGMPDLEGLTLKTARESGLFGAFMWKIRAWIDGELVKQTTARISIAEQPGFAKPERKNPMEELNQALSLVKTVREAFGDGRESRGGDTQSATLLGRLEAMETYRRELREVEERAEKKLRDETKEAFERGKREGEREARAEMERKIWSLERELELERLGTGAAPDMVEKVVGLLGGPDSVKGLVGGLVAAASRPNAREVRPAPPARFPQPRPLPRPGSPAGPQLMTAPVPAPAPSMAHMAAIKAEEPTPERLAESLALLGEAAAVLESSSQSGREDIQALAQGFQRLRLEGATASGPGVAVYWAKANQAVFPVENGQALTWLELAERLLDEDETEDGEDEMDTDEMKELLLQRLKEGKSTDEILAELQAVVPEPTRNAWKGLLCWMPTAGALGFLGIPAPLHDRGAAVLEAFKAA